MKKLELILAIAFTKELLLKAVKIAFVVGIILNLINQGDFIMKADMNHINFYKLVFTFFVPFFVSMYTAITMKMKFQVDALSFIDADLLCVHCKSTYKIKQGEKVPLCNKCLEKTKWKIKE